MYWNAYNLKGEKTDIAGSIFLQSPLPFCSADTIFVCVDFPSHKLPKGRLLSLLELEFYLCHTPSCNSSCELSLPLSIALGQSPVWPSGFVAPTRELGKCPRPWQGHLSDFLLTPSILITVPAQNPTFQKILHANGINNFLTPNGINNFLTLSGTRRMFPS